MTTDILHLEDAEAHKIRTQQVLRALGPQGLTPALVAELRRPFAVVKFRPAAKNAYGGKLFVLAYLDSALVAERLDDVAPGWSAKYHRVGASFADWKAGGYITECALTVAGVTRTDVGVASFADPVKGAYSDALKRAAWRFGVGSYLRDDGLSFAVKSPVVDANGRNHGDAWTTKKDSTEVKALTAAGRAQLLADYRALVTRESFVKRYGTIVEFGATMEEEAEHDEVVAADADEAQAERSSTLTEAQAAFLATLGEHAGKRTLSYETRLARLEGVRSDRYAHEVERTVAAVGKHLNLDPDARRALIDAGTEVLGDAEAALAVLRGVIGEAGGTDANA